MPVIPLKSAGFSLIEVMVTVVVTTIGLVGLVALLLESDRSVQDSAGRAVAVMMIDDISNRIRANPEGAESYDTNGGVVDCSSTPTTMCASYHDGNSRSDASDCSASQMATFDLWQVACPSGADDSDADLTRATKTDSIASPQLQVAVTPNQGESSNAIKIELQVAWDSRSTGTDADGNVYYNSDSAEITTRTSSITSEFVMQEDE